MAKILIVYFSHGGNTRKMAEAIAEGLREEGLEVTLRRVAEVDMDEVAAADGLILGSPCYFGNMAADMKRFLDESIKLFGKGALEGKPGGAFVSTGGIGGGGELALMSLLAGQLIHGMVVPGLRRGGHLGPLAIGEPDDRVRDECRRYATVYANLVKRLSA